MKNYFFEMASFFHKDFEKMAEISVRIMSFGKKYDITGEGFSAVIEAEELKQLCPNKRISGKVIETIGDSPIFVGETVQMIFPEKGEIKVRILLGSMSPDVAVRRFLREGEITEAERILRKKEILFKFGWTIGFIIVFLSSILAGYYDTWKPIIFILIFPIFIFLFDKFVLTPQLRQVLD